MADASVGEVDILLDGKEHTLRCGLAAAKRVNSIAGGYFGALGRLGALDHDCYVLVISAGLNKKPSDVDEAVYRNGLPDLTQPLTTFVQNLANGGKPIAPDIGDGKTGEA